jgi:hypothetical protein
VIQNVKPMITPATKPALVEQTQGFLSNASIRVSRRRRMTSGEALERDPLTH